MFSKFRLLRFLTGAIIAYVWLNYIKRGAVYESNKTLHGKTILITGGNTGVGKATALDLASRGARVIIASRNVIKSEAAKKEIMMLTNNQNIAVHKLDLSNFKEVRIFAKFINDKEKFIDILINNAGANDIRGRLSSGLNRMYAVNHFGHFLLTHLLLDKMKAQSLKRPVRIINLSSSVHRIGSLSEGFFYEDSQSIYDLFKIYASTKLANIYFTSELHEQLKNYKNVSTFSVHPGYISSELGMDFWAPFSFFLSWIAAPIAARTPYYGSQTTLYCALDNAVVDYSGDYFSNCKRVELEDHAKNQTLQKHIWKRSLEITGLNIA